MPIPDYQTLMLPFLKLTMDQQEHQLSELTESLANTFELSLEDRERYLPGGTQRIFKSRVSWAGTYLKKAKLLDSRQKGSYRITERGLQLLLEAPVRIDIPLLLQYDDFLAFYHRRKDPTLLPVQEPKESLFDPFESLEQNNQALRATLAEQLLDMLQQSSPAFFEKLVIRLLLAMGYGGTHQDLLEAVKGRSGDQGIDGRIKQDPLGFEEIYIQAKRWSQVVGRPEVQQFAGSMDLFHARKGVLFTTSAFSKEAYHYIQTIGKKIVLLDGEKLVNLMIDHNIGVTVKSNFTVKEVDSEFFE